MEKRNTVHDTVLTAHGRRGRRGVTGPTVASVVDDAVDAAAATMGSTSGSGLADIRRRRAEAEAAMRAPESGNQA